MVGVVVGPDRTRRLAHDRRYRCAGHRLRGDLLGRPFHARRSHRSSSRGHWRSRAAPQRCAEPLSRPRRRPGARDGVVDRGASAHAQAYLLGLGLGLTVPFRYYLLFMPIGLLMLLLPISISGFGLPQGVIVWLLRPMGVAEEQSFALSTLIVLTGLAGNLPGLILWLRANGSSP